MQWRRVDRVMSLCAACFVKWSSTKQIAKWFITAKHYHITEMIWVWPLMIINDMNCLLFIVVPLQQSAAQLDSNLFVRFHPFIDVWSCKWEVAKHPLASELRSGCMNMCCYSVQAWHSEDSPTLRQVEHPLLVILTLSRFTLTTNTR